MFYFRTFCQVSGSPLVFGLVGQFLHLFLFRAYSQSPSGAGALKFGQKIGLMTFSTIPLILTTIALFKRNQKRWSHLHLTQVKIKLDKDGD